MEIINKSFKEWKQSELQKYLGLEKVKHLPTLQNWLEVQDMVLSEYEKNYLQNLMEQADVFIEYWNEQELIVKFITFLIHLVGFDSYQHKINSFVERPLEATIQNEIFSAKLYGIVDWIVATGIQEPEHPFFFIHEYKAEKGKSLDGRGQLLAAMMAAQKLNQKAPEPTLFNPIPKHYYKDIPIYGAYVTGRFWFFVVLEESNYSISDAFDAVKIKDLQAIFKILKAQKQIIYSYLEKP